MNLLISRSTKAPAELNQVLPWISFAALLCVYISAFGGYFPNPNGGVGHDYAAFLPHLLAGRYWFETNGWLAVPWFTPAWCAGIPLLPDPQSLYYSIPQLLAFVFDPLTAVYLSLLLFASVGFWGAYVLARQCFGLSRAAASLCAGIFMFNGFFAYRIIIGHFSFHGFMLFPWFAWCLLLPKQALAAWPALFRPVALGALAGFIGAYWIYAGMVHLVPPLILTMLVLVCVSLLYHEGLCLKAMLIRGLVGATFMATGSALKLHASLAFLAQFPRSDYPLPGLQQAWYVVELLFMVLFMAPPNIHQQVAPALVNAQWALGRHEFEFGVGVVPLAALLWWLARANLLRALQDSLDADTRYWNAKRIVALLSLLLLLVLPIALNTYSPDWNQFLKGLPIIGSSSQLFRWFVVYIPLMALLTGMIIEAVKPYSRARLVYAALVFVAVSNLASDKLSYANETHRPSVTVAAEHRLSVSPPPTVNFVRLQLFGEDKKPLGMSTSPNELFVGGESAIGCYQPMFGYGLEHFPLGSLKEGPATELNAEGRFNFKNPACYVFPEANQCKPGDHFAEAERESLDRLLSYRPYDFRQPLGQQIANWLTRLTLLAWLALAALAGYQQWRSYRLGQRLLG